MRQWLFFTLAMLIFAACKDDLSDIPQQPEGIEGIKNLVIRASINGYKQDISDTKVTIDDFNGLLNPGLAQDSKWEVGDSIGLLFFDIPTDPADPSFGLNKLPVGRAVFKAKTSGKVVEFEYVSEEAGYPIPTTGFYNMVAVYPESLINIYKQLKEQSQIGQENHLLDVMYAQNTVGMDMSKPDSIAIDFNHMFSLVRFSLQNKSGEPKSIERITLSSSSSQNKFLTNVTYNWAVNYIEIDNEEKEMNLECFSYVIDNGSIGDFYMMIPGNVVLDNSDDFIVTVELGGGVEQVFNIPRAGYEFLKKPFLASARHYFQLVIAGPNIVTIDHNGIRYLVNTTDLTAKASPGPGFNTTATTLQFPPTIPGAPAGTVVTTISGFGGNTALTEVILPPSVKIIGENAFVNCENLTTINLSSATNLGDIGANAFSNTDLTSITIPQSVKSIGNEAFQYNTNLASVTFDSDVLRRIGDNAFASCSTLTDISIKHVQIIGGSAFTSCVNLTTVDLPSMLDSIGTNAFQDTKLTTLNLRTTNPPFFYAPVFTGLGNFTMDIRNSANFAAFNFEIFTRHTTPPIHPRGWTHDNVLVEPINYLAAGKTIVLTNLSGATGNVTITTTL